MMSNSKFYEETGQSWYTPKPFTDEEKFYFKLIESTIRVQYPSGKWDFIKLQPHQREFHRHDIALIRGNAKNDIDIKSRNTSFTVDSVIRLLTGNYYYHDEIVPIVRINENKVKEIIDQIAKIIKHMKPLKMSDGSLFPFNPEKVEISSMSIKFTDIGVTFQGYTSASPDSAENIRGIRTCRGLLDECFYKTTLITTDKGDKQIYSIKPGDLVQTFNEKTKELEYKKVIAKSKKECKERNLIEVKITNCGNALMCTENHPFYTMTSKGIRIKKAENLKAGDKIISNKNTGNYEFTKEQKEIKISQNNYKLIEIKSTNKIKKRCCVYNLEVEDNHNYFAAKMLVHNCNFFMYWSSIWGAMKGAARGADDEGLEHFQVTIGTTLRGETEFLQWFRDVENKTKKGELNDYTILRFPVFDPEVFNPEKPPIEQKELIPIVFWHTVEKLNNEWVENKDKFMEEYMAVIAPSEGAYYDIQEVISCSTVEKMNLYEAAAYAKKNFKEDSINILGIDPAGEGTDYFSIQCVNHDMATKKKTHFFSYNVQKTTDPIEAVQMCEEYYETLGCKKARVDGNDLGYFIATSLRKKYGGYAIEVMRGSVKVKDNELSIPIKEFLHSNLKKDIRTKNISLIIDELIIEHFKVWKNDYSGERSREFGHGDSVIAIGLANLPLNWRLGGKELPSIERPEPSKDESEEFYGDMKQRISFYRKNRNDSWF
jgi:hypothetical protein